MVDQAEALWQRRSIRRALDAVTGAVLGSLGVRVSDSGTGLYGGVVGQRREMSDVSRDNKQ